MPRPRSQQWGAQVPFWRLVLALLCLVIGLVCAAVVNPTVCSDLVSEDSNNSYWWVQSHVAFGWPLMTNECVERCIHHRSLHPTGIIK